MGSVCLLLFGTIWVFFIIDAVAGDILPYWEPDPQFDIGRRANKQGNITEPINKEKKNTFQRVKQLKLIITGQLNGTRTEERPTYRSKNNLRFADKSKQKMTNQHIQETISTRVAPIHPMKQEENTKTDGNSAKLPFVLNPYSYADQFNELISSLTDAAVETEVLGRTASYIDILLFKISYNGSKVFRAHQENKYVENETKEKKIIFIVHALSIMGVPQLYSLTVGDYLEKLISFYLAHLDKFDIYLMPIGNPDGLTRARLHSYSFWNKNLSPNPECPGVDVDRNFDVAWNSSGESNSCSQHYSGPAPFSEPESRAVKDVLHRVSHKIAAYIHVHAGTYHKKIFKGDAILYPKGYTDQQSDDDKYMDLRGEIDEAMKNANFKVISVIVDTLYNWYGPVFGTSVDYAATIFGIPYAMEMVMQPYASPTNVLYKAIVNNQKDEMEFYALTEIWRRIIDVTFRNIYKKLETVEITR